MIVELQSQNNRFALRIERRFAHRLEKVWRAITDPHHLNQWFPFDVALDPASSKIAFSEKSGESPAMDGAITAFDPPHVLAYSWGDDLLHFELRPDGDGCLLIFTHTFDDRAGAASFAAGWHICLDAMAMVLDGRPVNAADYVGPEWSRQMAELHEKYIEVLDLRSGTAELTTDGWQVRFERQLTQPIDKVWAILTTAGAPVVGGPAPHAFTVGKISSGAATEVEAPTLLEYNWHVAGRPAGRVRWQLGNGAGHGARLILTQTGPRELAAEQSTALTAWQTHIERLAKQLLNRPAASPTHTLGTLVTTADGRFALRFERRFAHPPEKVWRAITELDQLRGWFPVIVNVDLTPGAKLRFELTPEAKARFDFPEGEDAPSYGEVTLFDPPRLLEYTWAEEILRWELEADGAGGCRLVFTNSFDDRAGAADMGAGWHVSIEVLAAQLDGREAGWSVWERAEQLKEDYVRSVG